MFDNLSQALVEFLLSVVNLLPDSPFLFLDEMEVPATVIMGYVNWFIDFQAIVNITVAWVGCVLGWYVYRTIFKWAKLAS